MKLYKRHPQFNDNHIYVDPSGNMKVPSEFIPIEIQCHVNRVLSTDDHDYQTVNPITGAKEYYRFTSEYGRKNFEKTFIHRTTKVSAVTNPDCLIALSSPEPGTPGPKDRLVYLKYRQPEPIG